MVISHIVNLTWFESMSGATTELCLLRTSALFNEVRPYLSIKLVYKS